MKYDLDSNGYILNVYEGCYAGECIEYTGTTPSGYSTIDDWMENANTRAYKIVSGNLVYDADKDIELQEKYAIENGENEYATHKYVDDKLNQSATIYDDTLSSSTTSLKIEDAGNYEIPDITIKALGDITTTSNTSITDAKGGEYDTTIYGYCNQNGTPTPTAPVEIETCKGVTNLLNMPYTENNKLTYTATKTDDWKLTNYYATLEANKTYTFSCKTDATSWGNWNTQVQAYVVCNGVYTNMATNPFTFTPTTSGNYYIIYDVNINGETHSFWNFQIEKGKSANDYVPYGTWLNVKDTNGTDTNISTINMNKYNLLDLTQFQSVTSNGVTITNLGGGAFNINGTASTGFGFAMQTSVILSKGSFTHYVINELPSGMYASLNNVSETMLGNSTNLKSVSWSINSETTYATYYVWFNKGIVFNNYVYKPIICYGFQNEYFEVCKLGDIQDELTIENGKAKLLKKIDKYVFNGTESVERYSVADASKFRFFVNISGKCITTTADAVKNLLCNCGISISRNDAYLGVYGVSYTSYNNKIQVYFDTTSSMTMAQFKTWLTTQNLTIYYILETPYEVNLGSIDNLTLFKDTNNLSNNANADMDTTYVKNKTTLSGGLKLQVSNDNLLINKASSKTINGVKFEINDDTSISVSGTATAATEFILNGSMENTEPVFILDGLNSIDSSASQITYYTNTLPENTSLKLYSYNGIDREQVYQGRTNSILVNDYKGITCSTLSIANGTTVDFTYYPLIRKQDVSEDYKLAKVSDVIDLDLTELSTDDTLIINRNYAILNDEIIKNINTLKTYKDTLFNLISLNSSRLEVKTRYFKDDYLNERISAIEVEQNEISLTVAEKVGNDEIISKINQSAEEVAIQANKIKLEGAVTANNNFKINLDGSMETLAGKIGNWNIDQSTNGGMLYADNYYNGNRYRTYIQDINPDDGEETWVFSEQKEVNNELHYTFKVQADGSIDASRYIRCRALLDERIQNNPGESFLNYNGLFCRDSSGIIKSYYAVGGCSINGQCVATEFIPSSLEEKKKNFEKFQNGLGIINATDIYKYNFKSEDDGHKKHIGFVIGDKYNYSNEITGLDIDGNEIGADTYSMVSVCFQAIKEQQQQIEKLQKEIELLKEGK